MVRGIEHTAIAARDVAALADWYVAALGFRICYQSANATFVKGPDGSMIEIIRADEEIERWVAYAAGFTYEREPHVGLLFFENLNGLINFFLNEGHGSP